MRKKKTAQTKDLKKITQPQPNFEKGGVEEFLSEEQIKDLGFDGKPVIVEKWVNKLHPPVGIRDHDIDAGNVAYFVDGKWIRSPHIGDGYFKANFVKAN